MKFVELAGGFVEIFVIEFGDAPLFFLHLGRAVGVEFLGSGADGGADGGGWGLGKGEGFKTGVVSVASSIFKGRTLYFYPGSMDV